MFVVILAAIDFSRWLFRTGIGLTVAFRRYTEFELDIFNAVQSVETLVPIWSGTVMSLILIDDCWPLRFRLLIVGPCTTRIACDRSTMLSSRNTIGDFRSARGEYWVLLYSVWEWISSRLIYRSICFVSIRCNRRWRYSSETRLGSRNETLIHTLLLLLLLQVAFIVHRHLRRATHGLLSVRYSEPDMCRRSRLSASQEVHRTLILGASTPTLSSV